MLYTAVPPVDDELHGLLDVRWPWGVLGVQVSFLHDASYGVGRVLFLRLQFESFLRFLKVIILALHRPPQYWVRTHHSSLALGKRQVGVRKTFPKMAEHPGPHGLRRFLNLYKKPV